MLSIRRASDATSIVAGEAATVPGVVVVHSMRDAENSRGHESVTRIEIARKLAALKGYDFAGDYDASACYAGSVYFVPSDTVIGIETALEMGIRSDKDLFGGVAPYPFVATKVITHPLFDPGAYAPAGWSSTFGQCVRHAVLPGFAAFTLHDARRAGLRLLQRGPVRVKLAQGIGGRGQAVATDAGALDALLGAMDADELARHGLAVEQDLVDVTTCSVGQVRVGRFLVSYYGIQRSTPDNSGATVYGGSTLVVVRGGFDVLLRLGLSTEARLAVAQARAYDAAAMKHFPGLFASRRNYDVAQGLDADGRRCSGVLEQSWRIGGASAAEVGAFEAFRADAALRAVRASSTEIYGASETPPPGATIYFRDIDDRVGLITKYATVEPYVDA
jgi:hypothetical protein